MNHPLIKITNCCRYYYMGDNVVRALDDVTFEANKGEFVSIVGQSGSGKSTMMNILGCIDKPDKGSYTLNNLPVSTFTDEQLSAVRSHQIGIVFQNFNLLADLTVLENIAVPLAYQDISYEERLIKAKKYATMMGLGERTHHKPRELSGGQAQRVAIARALVNEPEILLADEPTGALDSNTSKEIISILKKLNEEGLTILLITHDTNLANIGSRKIVLKDGKIQSDKHIAKYNPAPPVPVEEGGWKHGLSFSDVLRIGVKEGLLTHMMRTFLTMLGVIIGVTSVIAMSSFSLGSKEKQIQQIRALGVNKIIVKDKRFEDQELLEARRLGSRGLSLLDSKEIQKNINGIKSLAIVREINMNVYYQQSGRIQATIYGVEGDYLKINNRKISIGRFISEAESRSSARVAVIGSAIWKTMGSPSLGDLTIIMGASPYRVIGVLEDLNYNLDEGELENLSDVNQTILIPLNAILSRTVQIDDRNEIDEIQLQVEDEELLSDTGTAIKRLLTFLHYNVDDFSIEIPLTLLKQKQQSSRLLDILSICIASISLVVGGIGIMNVMLTSVTERTKEIGIRRALGATKKDIRNQFLIESILISFGGGLLGITLAFVTIVVVSIAIDLPIVFSPAMIIISILFSVGTGLGFGIYPALQAADKKPVEALRYE